MPFLSPRPQNPESLAVSAPRATLRSRPRRRPHRPGLDPLESRELLSIEGPGITWPLRPEQPGPAPIFLSLAPQSSMGHPAGGVVPGTRAIVMGQTLPDRYVGMDANQDGMYDQYARSDRAGRFLMVVNLPAGADRLDFNLVLWRPFGMASLTVVGMPGAQQPARPFTGSPTPGLQPMVRLDPTVRSDPNARPDATALSSMLAEAPNAPSFSSTIPLGMVFFGQFVDHDVTRLDVNGQGPMTTPLPMNVRTPALDLDSVYGGGPRQDPQYYTPDGLFFRLGADGKDLLRDADGVAIIPDERNDDNGQVAHIQLAFQKFHNALMTAYLGGVDPSSLNQGQQDDALRPGPRPGDRRLPGDRRQRDGAADRRASRSTSRCRRSPTSRSSSRGPSGGSGTRWCRTRSSSTRPGTGSRRSTPRCGRPTRVPMRLLFGPTAQPAAALRREDLGHDADPADPALADRPERRRHRPAAARRTSAAGQVIDGVLHLDLGETNILRGRELGLPSGEELLAMIRGRPYDPATDGNTDLFVYILEEAAPLGHLGPVGSYVVQHSLGGILAADPYRWDNPAHYSPMEIALFRQATFEQVLHVIGEPGF